MKNRSAIEEILSEMLVQQDQHNESLIQLIKNDEMQTQILVNHGKKIEANSQKIEALGQKVEALGQKVEENGKRIEENGKRIDTTNNKLDKLIDISARNFEQADENFKLIAQGFHTLSGQIGEMNEKLDQVVNRKD